MIKLEETELLLAHPDEEDSNYFIAFLLVKEKAGTFDAAAFMEALGQIDEDDTDEEKVEIEISELMNTFGVLEMFERDDVEEFVENELIDVEELHESLYEVFVTEQMEN